MMTILFSTKKNNVKLFTESDTRDDLIRKAIVNRVAIKEALNPAKIVPVAKKTVTPASVNPHTATIQKLDEILGKVAGYENSKIATIAELALALETGDYKNLIKLLKTKDKVVVKKLK